MSQSTILKNTNWTDKSIDFIISDIVEYDIGEGGFSIIREKKLLPDEVITSLADNYDKKGRHVQIGKLQRKTKGLSQQMNEGFAEYRIRFGTANNLIDDDILSIKKDAIFVKKYCYNLKFDNYIEFVEKNSYEAYMNLNGLEIYWSSMGQIDIKGILDDNLKLHEDFLVKSIYIFIKKLTMYDYDGARKFIVKLIDDYKYLRLDPGYYREFNSNSTYKIKIDEFVVDAEYVGTQELNQCDITYNFKNVLVPLLRFVID